MVNTTYSPHFQHRFILWLADLDRLERAASGGD
jgi:hypothetical protein